MVFALALALGGCATVPPVEEPAGRLVEKVVEVKPLDAARIRNQSGPFLAKLRAQAAAEDMTIAYQYRGITLVRVHPDGRYVLGRGASDALYVREPATVTRPAPWDTVGTFSIVGYDPATAEVGVAVQSRVFSVGNGVIWGEAGVGVVATQAVVDVSYGPQALALLREGYSPAEVVERVLAADPNPDPERWSIEGRQFSVMNARGEVATHTGPRASDWAGAPHRPLHLRAGQHPGRPGGGRRHGHRLREHPRPPVPAAGGGPRSRSGGGRRYPRHAVRRPAGR